MSYSLDSIYHSASWAVWSHSQALFKLQEQAATGQAINRPSDNHTDANQIMDLQSNNRSIDQYLDTLTDVVGSLDDADIAIRGISGYMIKAMEELTDGSSSSMPTALADMIDGCLEDIVMLANSKDRFGRYLFGGAQSDSAPYLITRDSAGKITRVDYQGSYNERDVEVASGIEVSSVLVGDNIFRTDDRQGPVFMSADTNGVTTTGVVAGAGTSSVRGDIQLTVTDAGGGNFLLSIDGGLSTVAVTGHPTQSNIPVVNSVTGEVLFVDASGTLSVGTELIRVPGTYDVFNVLINARDILDTPESSLPAGVWDDMVNAAIGAMHTAQNNLGHAFPMVGGRIGTLTMLKDSITDMKYNTEESISEKRDADIAQIAVDLARHEVLYQMSLSVAAKMFSMSLMDYIA